MTEVTKEKITYDEIDRLIVEGQYHRALSEIEAALQITTLTEYERWKYSVLQCQLLTYLDKHPLAKTAITELLPILKLKAPDLVIQGNVILIECLWRSGDFSTSLTLIQETFQQLQDTQPHKVLHVELLWHQSVVYWSMGELAAALTAINQALQEVEHLKALGLFAQCYNIAGIIYFDMGDLDQALFYYQQGRRMLEEHGKSSNKNGLAGTINNIAMILSRKGELEQAKEQFLKCYELYKELGYHQNLAFVTSNIALVYYTQGELDLALSYYQQSLVLRKQYGNETDIAHFITNIGLIYQTKGDYERGLAMFMEALHIKEKYKNDIETAETIYRDLAEMRFLTKLVTKNKTS